jgi:hypothetical protein
MTDCWIHVEYPVQGPTGKRAFRARVFVDGQSFGNEYWGHTADEARAVAERAAEAHEAAKAAPLDQKLAGAAMRRSGIADVAKDRTRAVRPLPTPRRRLPAL